MKHLIFSFTLFVCTCAVAQNGKLLESVEYVYSDSLLNKAEQAIPGTRAAVQQTGFYRISYLSDGLRVKGYLTIPRKPGKYPCIIFNRGGNREFSAVTDETVLRLLARLAGAGYVIAASQYRGNAGGEGVEEFGGKDVNDVLNLMPLFASVPNADTSRIGMFGWSRGGMMTYIALTKTTKIKAAVVASGLADLPMAIQSRPVFDSLWSTLIPGFTTNKQEVLRQRSATQFAAQMNKTTPLLVLQGTADWRVPTDQVLVLVNELYKTKHPFRFILYEGAQHSLIEHRADYLLQIENWFNIYLRDAKAWPSLEPHGD